MKASTLYENFIFQQYEKDYQNHILTWESHFERMHSILNFALLHSQKNALDFGLVGCGLKPIERDFPVDFLQQYIITGKIHRLILIDFSRTILESAKDNLVSNGIPEEKLIMKEIDLTFGQSEKIGDMILNAISLGNKERILSCLSNIYPFMLSYYQSNFALSLDFIYCPMTILATLNPTIIKIFKILKKKKIGGRFKKQVFSHIDRIWKQHNEKTFNQFLFFFKNPTKQQDWLIITEISENRFNGIRKERIGSQLQNIIWDMTSPVFLHTEKPWVWWDSDDHYHEVGSFYFRW